jgi:ribonuclease HI
MMAEAIAMREGLDLANKLSLTRVQAESDSSKVTDTCKGDERWWNEASTIFRDCVDVFLSKKGAFITQ